MEIKRLLLLFAVGALALMLATAVTGAAEPPKSLKMGIVQVALEPTLAENQAKIARFIRQAKSQGCRVVVFPETSLYWQPEATKEQIDAAVEALRKEVAASDLYALIGGPYKRSEKDKPFERLLVIDPRGEIIQTYNKMWYDARFGDCPGLFEIDGVPCAASICADRWIRSVEELPAMAGAKILFEVSNNFDNEWLADLGWFWYVPRAVRNSAFVVFANTAKEDRAQKTPGHGHSAVIGPDGSMVASLGEESDKLLVVDLDVSLATGDEASARRSHPLFKPFWDRGVAILNGQSADLPPHLLLVSPQVELKIAAAQMACSTQLDENAARIVELIYQAKDGGADVVVFPELAVTGANEDDIRAAKQADWEAALALIQKAARQREIYVVVGLPWREGGKLYNAAAAIGPDGSLLTRYHQLVVDRPELFAAGTSTKAMWLHIKGVPAVVTVGRDALWSEIAELAALRGAQVHLHLAYDRQTSPAADLRRKQQWVNLASFRTFTATVNAASPRAIPNPSSPASGGSTIWDDFHRGQNRKLGGYGPYSAVPVAQAGQDETILYATQTIPATNPQFRILTEKTNPQMTPWYATGAAGIFSEVEQAQNTPGAKRAATYFPPPEKQGGWRTLVPANEAPSAEQQARIRDLAGLEWDRLNGAFAYSKSFGGPSSMVVIRHGWIAGEFFTDKNQRGIASCTKSLTGLSIAKLCELSAAGRLKKTISLDEPAWKYLPASWGEEEPRRKAILIRHMLTMSSGLDPYDGPYQDLDGYRKLILARQFEAEPGTIWAYASAPVDMLSLVVEDVSGQLMGDFFNEQIARPIGASAEFPKFGEHSGGSGGPLGGVRLATRDMARLGYLLLHEGRWQDESGDKQILSPQTVKRFTQWAPELETAKFRVPNLGSPGKEGAEHYYGHLFWTNRTQQSLGKAVPSDAYYMSGWGKQTCCVIPSLDMVVVRLGPHRANNEHVEYNAEFMSRVVSAVIDRP